MCTIRSSLVWQAQSLCNVVRDADGVVRIEIEIEKKPIQYSSVGQ